MSSVGGGARWAGAGPAHRGRWRESLRARLAARADAREREDVVGELREDRIRVVVLRRREAVEVLRAVRRPARPDEERHDRQLLEPDLLELRREVLLLRGVESHLPLV